MRKRRQAFTRDELRDLWSLWKTGHTLRDIGDALERPWHSLHAVIRRAGGMVPRERKRSERSLRLSEREEISHGLASDESLRCIARRLGRAPSTISREIRRHAPEAGDYRALEAEAHALQRGERSKRCKLSSNGALRRAVASKLALDWVAATDLSLAPHELS